jgi:hypothetical protein
MPQGFSFVRGPDSNCSVNVNGPAAVTAFETVSGGPASTLISALYDSGNSIEVYPTGVSEVKVIELLCSRGIENSVGKYSCRFVRGKVETGQSAEVSISGTVAERLFQALENLALEEKSVEGVTRQTRLVVCHDFPSNRGEQFPICAIAPIPAK